MSKVTEVFFLVWGGESGAFAAPSFKNLKKAVKDVQKVEKKIDALR